MDDDIPATHEVWFRHGNHPTSTHRRYPDYPKRGNHWGLLFAGSLASVRSYYADPRTTVPAEGMPATRRGHFMYRIVCVA